MRFTKTLYSLGTPILNEILHHPFILNIKNNTLNKNIIQDYVEQDTLYLKAYTKGYIEALHHAKKEEDILFLAKQVIDSIHGEDIPHHVLYDEDINITSINERTITQKYMEHIYSSFNHKNLIAILTTMLPCSWTYFEIAKFLLKEMDINNPLKEWAIFYSDDKNLKKICHIIDRESEKYSDKYLKKLQLYFLKSCQFEYLFWNQSYFK